MAKTLLDLADSFEKKSKTIKADTSKLAVDTAMAIVGNLAYKTPVDTSQAISNWIVTIGAENQTQIKPHFPGIQGSTYRASAAETIANAKAVLSSKKPGQSIFITNNLPYIKKLNDGSSSQAPAGFVESAVLIGRKMVAKFKLRA